MVTLPSAQLMRVTTTGTDSPYVTFSTSMTISGVAGSTLNLVEVVLLLYLSSPGNTTVTLYSPTGNRGSSSIAVPLLILAKYSSSLTNMDTTPTVSFKRVMFITSCWMWVMFVALASIVVLYLCTQNVASLLVGINCSLPS